MSQPSLSNQVIKLEHELGEKLFHRMKQRAIPTASGQAFLDHARRVLNEIDQAKRAIHDFTECERGSIDAGVLPTIAPYLFAKAASDFQRRFPGIEIVISENTTENLLQAVENGTIDFALLACPVARKSLKIESIASEDLLGGRTA